MPLPPPFLSLGSAWFSFSGWGKQGAYLDVLLVGLIHHRKPRGRNRTPLQAYWPSLFALFKIIWSAVPVGSDGVALATLTLKINL